VLRPGTDWRVGVQVGGWSKGIPKGLSRHNDIFFFFFYPITLSSLLKNWRRLCPNLGYALPNREGTEVIPKVLAATATARMGVRIPHQPAFLSNVSRFLFSGSN
jgi:hypothetical protein